MSQQQRPTEAEYTILRVLWQQGPGTVRDVHQILSKTRDIGYTSVLKTLQIMTEKGFVVRDEQARAHIYTPAFSEETAQGSLLADLLKRVFGGSSPSLVMRALQVQPATREERDEIRRLLDNLEKEE